MDYGKFKYEADMKAREARRNQANTVLKEIRFRLKIDPHDYETKKGHVVRFLEGGDKVKVMIMVRGREQSRPEMGVRLLTRLADEVSNLGSVESMPKQDGRNMTMVLGPVKKKADAKAEQRKRADEVNAGRITKSEARRAAAGGDAPDEPEVPAEVEVEVVNDAVEVPFEDVVAAAVEQTAAQAAQAAPAPVEQPVEAPVAPRSPAPRQAPARPAAARPAAARPAAAAPRPAAAAPRPAAAAPRPAATPRPAVPSPSAATPKPAAPKPVAPKPAPKPSPRSPR